MIQRFLIFWCFTMACSLSQADNGLRSCGILRKASGPSGSFQMETPETSKVITLSAAVSPEKAETLVDKLVCVRSHQILEAEKACGILKVTQGESQAAPVFFWIENGDEMVLLSRANLQNDEEVFKLQSRPVCAIGLRRERQLTFQTIEILPWNTSGR
jgi:hypothetical protein